MTKPIKKFWHGYYRTDDGRYIPIRAAANMYPATVELDTNLAPRDRKRLTIRGAKPENIEARKQYREHIQQDHNVSNDVWYHDQMKMLDIFAREAGCRIDGVSK